jgi:hypothetical protein
MTTEKLGNKIGDRIVLILDTSAEIKKEIENLENMCDIQSSRYNQADYGKGEWVREKILENAYVGCVYTALLGNKPVPRLKAFVKDIKETLEHNPYSDPAFYVMESYNYAFKSKKK